mgnify:CR=1 FL=1
MLPEARQKELKAFAEKLADIARRVLVAAHARVETEVEFKSDGTPVTVADKEAERQMRAAIKAAYPDHGILGEEFGPENVDAEHCWVLDPIDGTKSFLSRVPLYVTLIGLRHEGKPVLGVIDQPWLDERYVGVGNEAWLDCRGARTPLRTRDCRQLTHAVLSTTDPFILTPPERGAFDHLRATAKLTRYGLDAYAYARLAAGTIDLVAESGLKSWDVAALIPVVRGSVVRSPC